EFAAFLPMGIKGEKTLGKVATNVAFKLYSLGAFTGRDSSMYDFGTTALQKRVERFIEDYNGEVFRWIKAGRPKEVDGFVSYDKIKWSRNLKRDLTHERYAQFNEEKIRRPLYRPFTRKWLY